jgi:excisionase family DNA binding protein
LLKTPEKLSNGHARLPPLFCDLTRRVLKLPQEQILNQPAISIQGLAKRLDVSVRTARRLIRGGDLKAHRIGRQWRVFEPDLRTYLAGRANHRTTGMVES